MHIQDGDLRAYLDHELDPTQYGAVDAHLAACRRCRAKLSSLRTAAGQVAQSLSQLPACQVQTSYPAQALHRFEDDIQEKEKHNMFTKISNRRGPVLAAVLVLILAVSLAFPPVRALAVDFLGIFRVEKVQILPINMEVVAGSMNPAGLQIEQILAENMEYEQIGEGRQVASAEEAGEAAGLVVRLPVSLGTPDSLNVQAGAKMTFTVDLPRLRAILKEMGRTDTYLPENMDRAEIVAEISQGVLATYGDCTPKPATRPNYDPDDGPAYRNPECTNLLQVKSPTVNTPAGLDIDQIGQSALQLLGMTPEEAAVYSSRIDWASTLILPIPTSFSATEVRVDGVEGVLIEEDGHVVENPYYNLIWVKDGVLYFLQLTTTAERALAIANSFR